MNYKCLALVPRVNSKVAHEAIWLFNTVEIPTEKQLGRPKTTIDPTLASKICELVVNGNKTSIPMHSKPLKSELEKLGHSINVQNLQRHLIALEFHYGKGNRHNILHDFASAIDYRNVYLEKKLANLNTNGHPIVAEVFLDESYCHLDHHARLMWVPAKGVVNERGRKPILVIFGAFVVFRHDNKLKAHLERESILIWPVKSKHCVATIGRHGVVENELWQTVPEFVKISQILPNYHDYHGNFTANLFEKLSERLSSTLREDYGACYIHIDGAKYHVCKVDPQPMTSTRIADVHAWLKKKGVVVPMHKNGRPMPRI